MSYVVRTPQDIWQRAKWLSRLQLIQERKMLSIKTKMKTTPVIKEHLKILKCTPVFILSIAEFRKML